MAIPKLQTATLESISRVLADTSTGFTGTEIQRLLTESNIPDIDPANTKWKRLCNALFQKHSNDNCANHIVLTNCIKSSATSQQSKLV